MIGRQQGLFLPFVGAAQDQNFVSLRQTEFSPERGLLLFGDIFDRRVELDIAHHGDLGLRYTSAQELDLGPLGFNGE